MRRRDFCRATLALLAALAAPSASHATARAAREPDLADALDRLLDSAAAGAPGVLLSVALPDGRVWAGARGLADVARKAPLAPTDRFRIASITKPFVATVALQLAQEGWLTLDQTVEQWLPGKVPRGDRISLRMLLNHTSGLYDYMDDALVARWLDDPGRKWEPDELVAYATSHRARFAPGERFHYSNTNYVLLGLIIEKVTRTPLAHELRFRILEPLGLAETSFEPADPPAALTMRGYFRRRDITDLHQSFAWAAGNIVSTADDLTRFARGLLGGALLGPEALAEMQSFAGTGGWGEPSLAYGLGLMQRTLGASTARGHTGALGGYRTALWHILAANTTLVAAINTHSGDPSAVVGRAAGALLTL